MSEETTVGTIRGVLTMDDSPWSKTIEEAKAKARELGRTNPNIKIDVDAAGALTKLSAVKIAMNGLTEASNKVSVAQAKLNELQGKGDTPAAKLAAAQRALDSALRGQENAALRVASAQERATKTTKELGDETEKVEKKSKDAGKGMGLLATSILALGPALIPLAAVSVGALAGLIGTAGTALVVFMGIKEAMAQGTNVGRQYTAGMKVLNNEFTTLKQLSAAGFLGGFNAGLAALRPLFGTLNRDVSLFSTQLGGIVGHVVPALVALFHQLNPLFITFGSMLLSGSANFQHWAQSSTAVSKFVAYVQNELPNVLHFLGELMTLVGHLAQAFAPLGSGTLTTLGLLAQAINAIPISVLQTLVPLVTATVLAFKGFQALNGASTGLANMSGRLAEAGGMAGKMSGVVGTAATAMKFLGVAGLVAGPAIGIFTSILAKHQQQQMQTTQETNSFTDALVRSNGAIDENIRVMTVKNLTDSGALSSAKKLGLSLSDVTDAALGNAAAQQRVNEALDAQRQNILDAVPGYKDMGGGVAAASHAGYEFAKSSDKVTDAIGGQNKELDAAKQKYADQQAAINGVTKATKDSVDAQYGAARALGLTTAEYLTGVGAAKKNADAVSKQSEAMQFANDAAGLLKNSLDALNGVTLDISAAQTSAASAWIGMTKAIQANGRTTALNTEAGVANRQSIEQAVRASQQYAEAEAKKTKSGQAASKMLTDQRTAFIANIEKTYGANSAIAAYTRSIYGIPAAKTTLIDAQVAAAAAKIAAIKAALAAIPPKWIPLNIDMSSVNAAIAAVGRLQNAQSNANNHNAAADHSAGGSTVHGPGSETSDSVPMWLSNGEEVIKASEAKKHRGLLKAINAGKMATGGTVGDPYGYTPQQAAASAAKKKKTAKPKPVPIINGAISTTAGNGQAFGIATIIKNQVGQARAAMTVLSAAVNDAFQLKGVEAQIRNTKNNLANLQKASGELRSTVTGNLTGALDPSKYGSISDLIDAYKNRTATNRQFAAEDNSASRKGLNKGLLAQLAALGPSAGLSSVAGGSAGEIAQLNAAYKAFNATAGSAGVAVSGDVYGSQIKAQQALLAKESVRAKSLENAVVKLVGVIGKMTNRPVEVKIGNQVVAKAVIGSNEFQGVLDGLTNQILYGRKH